MMPTQVRFGYRAVAEQYPPQKLLQFTQLAEEAGFEFVSISDHFHPWFHDGGHAAFAWVWLAAAAERTRTIRLGTGVTTPINRYHPAIIAQAFATLGVIYPGRIRLGLGTGEAMNEIPVGQRWPPFEERATRLEESLKIIRALWENDFATFQGKYFSVKDARLYDRPSIPIPIYLAAGGARMAEMAGRLADGLYTAPTQEAAVRDVLFPSLRRGAKEASRDFEKIARLTFCNIVWDADYDKARVAIRRWRATAYPGIFSKNMWDPRKLDELGEKVAPEDLEWRWVICTDLDEAIKGVERWVKLGFNEVEIRSCSPNEEEFIRRFGREALPYLRELYGG